VPNVIKRFASVICKHLHSNLVLTDRLMQPYQRRFELGYATTFSMMTFSIMTLRLIDLLVTLSVMTLDIIIRRHYANANMLIVALYFVMLNITILSVVMLNVIVPSVVMLYSIRV
jgi:hypothetical protein